MLPLWRARAVDRAYCALSYAGNKRPSRPSRVSTCLPEDALTAVRVPEIEPPLVRPAWRAYRVQKLKYLAALEEAELSAAKKKIEEVLRAEQSPRE